MRKDETTLLASLGRVTYHKTLFKHKTTGEYFARTYDNSQIVTARLTKENLNAATPVSLGQLTREVEFGQL